jgi:tetratricopeptide (TPR) repeat protein
MKGPAFIARATFLTLFALGPAIVPLCARGHGDLGAELIALNRSLARAPQDTALILRRAELYRRLGHPTLAMADASDLLRSQPDHPEALRWLALAAYDAGDRESALAASGHFLKANPSSRSLRRMRARVFREEGAFAQEIQELEAALATTPDVDFFLNLARAHRRGGQNAEAASALQRGLARHGKNPALARLQIELALEDKRWPEAIQWSRRMARGGGFSARWLFLQGLAHQGAGHLPEAQAAFQEALQKLDGSLAQRDSATRRLVRAQIHWAQSDVPRARADLQRVLNKWPRTEEAHRLARDWAMENEVAICAGKGNP